MLHDNPQGQEVYDNIGLRPVLEKVQEVVQSCDVIWMQPLNQTYMYYLFLTRTPPQQFQNARIQKNLDIWLNIKWFDNVRFGIPNATKIDAPTMPNCQGKPSQTYFITRRSTLPEGWQDLIIIRNDSNKVLWRAAFQS